MFKYSKKKEEKKNSGRHLLDLDPSNGNFMMLNLKKIYYHHLIAWNSILQIEFSQNEIFRLTHCLLWNVRLMDVKVNERQDETQRWLAWLGLEENKAFWNIRNAVILYAINLCAFNAEMKLSVKVYDPGLLQGCVAY